MQASTYAKTITLPNYFFLGFTTNKARIYAEAPSLIAVLA